MRNCATVAMFVLLITSAFSSPVATLEILESGAGNESPEVIVDKAEAQRLDITFTLPSLTIEDVDLAGERFQTIGFTGAVLSGKPGRAALPSLTKMIALAPGSRAALSVVVKETRELSGVRVLPMQDDDDDQFMIDRAWYSGNGDLEPPIVELGVPAQMGNLRVQPLIISPIRFDPTSGTLQVIERLELRIDFEADSALPAIEAPRRVPESFDRLYRDLILNFDAYREQGAEAEVGPGTWLVIAPNNATVLSILEPLLEWRRRMGYTVQLATTNETGTYETEIKNYIQGVYDSADPPLEFVTLAGDATGSYSVDCWNESLSYYYGEGDHYYSMLAGDDILSDVHLGRLSFRSTNELQIIVDKILSYETEPPLTDPGWFTRAGLCGDPYNDTGISAIYANQWLKSQLLAAGYSQVDTIWSGNFPYLMTQSINQGLGVFGYRGIGGMSGLSSNGILYLQNGNELPYAIIVTCDTGSFQDDYTARSEAFLRAANGGGIGCVGTATIGTHTRYNETYYYGAWDGVINGSDHRLGSSHTRGKYELFLQYGLNQMGTVEIWSVWNNLMGDPATDIYTALPQELTVDYPLLLPTGAGVLPVAVTAAGMPLPGARVTVYRAGELSLSAYSDDNGEVLLPLSPGLAAGELLVTVTGHNLLAHMGSMNLGPVSVFANLSQQIIDDDTTGASLGNGDGRPNPGERLEISLALRNLGGNTATAVAAVLSCTDPYVEILAADQDFGDIPPGAESWSAGEFLIAVAADAPDGLVLDLRLDVTSGLGDFVSLLSLEVGSSALTYEGFGWSEGSGLDPGESGSLTIDLGNSGSLLAQGISATLVSNSPWLSIDDGYTLFDNLIPGASGDNGGDPFGLSVAADAFPGHLASFSLLLNYNDRAVGEVEFQLPVGSASVVDPTGPDMHGYYAFESQDTEHPQAPIFDWVEIAPSQGGPGNDVGLTDFGSEQDDTRTLDLPFDFTYYGQVYDRISICSNGWASLGTTSLVLYRNFSIPCVGSPPALIAPFWDNLYQSGNDRVYWWYDGDEHRYVVQWSRVRSSWNSSTQDFELILYDPAHHPTATGDGEIRFQYAQVGNHDGMNGYATVGIQNHARDDGLLLSYWNQHPASASNPAANQAVRFLPLDDALEPVAMAEPAALTTVIQIGGNLDRWLAIANEGDAGSLLYYRIDTASLPDWLSIGETHGVVPAGGQDMLSISFDASNLSLGLYETVLAINHSGEGHLLVPVSLQVNGDATDTTPPPTVLSLAQNHPNPFNPSTTIRFALPQAAPVDLSIFDLEGRTVRTLLSSARLEAGEHRQHWQGRDDEGRVLPSGIYFCELRVGEERLLRKLTLLK